MDAERSDNADSADEDPRIVQVYAGNIAGVMKTSSPTSDALDSAEVLIFFQDNSHILSNHILTLRKFRSER